MKKCLCCRNEFTPKSHSLICERCYRIAHHLCVKCGKQLSHRAIETAWIDCYECSGHQKVSLRELFEQQKNSL